MLPSHSPTHAKWQCISLLGCTVHRIHTRLSAHIATHSGGCPLLEYINNVNKSRFLGSQPRGIILLGDSAGAHFHIPPEWLTASQMSVVSNFGRPHSGCAGLCLCSVFSMGSQLQTGANFPLQNHYCYYNGGGGGGISTVSSRQRKAKGFSPPHLPSLNPAPTRMEVKMAGKPSWCAGGTQPCVRCSWKSGA